MRAQRVTLALSFGAALVAAVAMLPVSASAASSWHNNKSNMNNSQQPDSQSVHQTLNKMKKNDDEVGKFMNSSYGYAVFPSVGEGAAVVGAAHGSGKVYAHNQLVGKATITKINVGAQLGGETYSEVIFFKNKHAFDRFKQGNYAFSASASAVAVKSGGQARNNYEDGVAVFTMAKGGLMGAVAVGGQKFSYTPIRNATANSGQ